MVKKSKNALESTTLVEPSNSTTPFTPTSPTQFGIANMY